MLQANIKSKLATVNKQDQTIKDKLASIQAKIKAITCPYPDDMVLLMNINELATRIEERKLPMLSF